MFKPTLKVASLAAIVIALSYTSIAQAEGISRAMMLSNSCAACHGTDGRGSLKIPKLRGEKAKDIIQEMNGFKEGGDKKVTVMEHVAKGYTDEEVELMADYFSALKK